MPWIRAYPGARVITQLGPEDFLVHEGIDAMRIVADLQGPGIIG